MKVQQTGNRHQQFINVTEAIILANACDAKEELASLAIPPALALLDGRPLLSRTIDMLRMQGIQRLVFVLGHAAVAMEAFLKENYPSLDYATVVQARHLGTGGDLRMALQKIKGRHVLVADGTRFLALNLPALWQQHQRHRAECTLALKALQQANGPGGVCRQANGQITAVGQPKLMENGFIQTGFCLLAVEKFFRRSFDPVFSFEKDYLTALAIEGLLWGDVQDGYFFDSRQSAIIPALPQPTRATLDLWQIDQSWTLFIDRDGVINEETIGEYVLHWKQFVFSRGVLQALKKLSSTFGRLLVVTNQRGVGKGLMTRKALDAIHAEMLREIIQAGGHIEKIYDCTDVDSISFNRKPNPGMAVQAKRDFPAIDFARSVMVGNKPSDMRFGRAAGMFTVFLATTNPEQPFPHPDIDLRFQSLEAFAAALNNRRAPSV